MSRRIYRKVALDRLFDELEGMGRAAEVLGVERSGRNIRFGFAGRVIGIISTPSNEDPSLLDVTASDVEEELSGYLQPELMRFVLRITKPATETRPELAKDLILGGAGLAWLVENGLGLDVGAEE